MHPRFLAACIVVSALTFSPELLAAPSIEKERLGPVPTESSLSRDEALKLLVEAEGMLNEEQLGEALAKMLEAYVALEQSEGAEARGVKELRSWLVKALEGLALPDEAATIRARGSFVDHPLSVMPSTWFVAGVSEASEMNVDAAVEAVERGLDLLTQGDIQGLTLLLAAYEVLERELGPEHEDVAYLRSFLVGLLETGGFIDEGAALRARGSVTEANEQDTQIYVETWSRVIGAANSADSVIGGGATSGSSSSGLSGGDQGTSSSGLSGGDQGSSSSESSSSDQGYDYDDSDDADDDRPRVLERGSVVPGVLIDIGVGSYQPDYGRKGLLWTLGLDLHWTLFRAKFFSMQIGGGGQFGRNRDKRWLADARGELGLGFDFGKVYIRPEFGGGYDQIAGGKLSIAEAHHVAPAPYYHFGGTLGVHFAERFGIYGRAVRLNRGDTPMPNETRLRAGFTVGFDQATLDTAFVFTDYEARDEDLGARLFSANVGFRF